MNLHVNQEQLRQSANHKAVRERLMNPSITVKRADIDKAQTEVAELKAMIAGLSSDLADKTQEVRRLELDVADRNARIIALAEELAKLDVAGVNAEPKKTVASIVAEILRDYPGITWQDVVGLRRTRDLITPRHLCMVAVFEQRKDLSLPMIGRIFNRDHTTILAAMRKHGCEGEGKPLLKPEKVEEIYRLHDSGVSFNEIARRVGCSSSSVGRYIQKAKEQA